MLSTAAVLKANCCVSQGGTIVNADRQFGADVLIKDGLIHAVGKDLEVPLCCILSKCFHYSVNLRAALLQTSITSLARSCNQTVQAQVPAVARVIIAAGKLVMPGGIDPHTHLDAPMMGTVSCDDFYRRACLPRLSFPL